MNRISLWDVITYAFESRSSEKMWVRAFLYAAIRSLEDGPGNNVHLPISPISPTHRCGLLKCRRSNTIVSTSSALTHTLPTNDRFSRLQTGSGKTRKIMQIEWIEKLFLTHSHTRCWENLEKTFRRHSHGAVFAFSWGEAAATSVWVQKYFQFS